MESTNVLQETTSMSESRHEATARSARKAEEVFGIPELLENILHNLDPLSLLKAQQVGRAWRDGINGSRRLQRDMGLIPDPHAYLSSPFLQVRDKSIHRQFQFHEPSVPKGSFLIELVAYVTDYGSSMYRISPEDLKTSVQVVFDVFLEEIVGNPKLGSRSRAIQVCQPPLKELTVHFHKSCSNAYSYMGQQGHRYISERGFTVGDVLDILYRWAGKNGVNHKCEPVTACIRAEWFDLGLRGDDPVLREVLAKHKMLHEKWLVAKAASIANGEKKEDRYIFIN